MSSPSSIRLDLDGNPIKPITICIIDTGGFIGSHLCEKLMLQTPHKVLALDVYNNKLKHLLELETLPWNNHFEFHRLNIKNDPILESLIKTTYLVINLVAIYTPIDYNTSPLHTIYNNFIVAIPVVKHCSENNKRLVHFSTCEVHGKTIGSFLPKDSPLRHDPAYYMLKEDESSCIFGDENGLEFTIVRPFNWIGPRMDLVPSVDGPSERVPRVLACFSNNLLRGEPLK
ncbi:putative UDP-glucuronate decarboxylase [Medicago truncatula]|uniref:Putative UDP-glucuronate decarboxylase n=1 Tax=Medicago truncatula TaxID=3880 RepID=A0A072V6U0_MEDTR|nr:UDP-D-apiose/UDP-D-xylose synthase [Medicago truncatula]RHN73614.1 putative UDP-glucuronate decarboxylase [Medicago truncatula]